MSVALSFAALAVAVGALAFASWRAAAALGADGALRLVAAAPLAASAAALTALVLGRFGLSGSQPLLVLGALALAGLAAARLPRPRPAFDLPLTARERLLIGAAAGAGLAWTAWAMRHPNLDIDALTYHLPESVVWAQQGDAGVSREVLYAIPIGSYPLLDELLVSWVLALGHSFSAALLWAPASWALFATAAVTGLRRAGVGLTMTTVAVAAIVLTPVLVTLVIGPHPDFGAVAWLTCAATLAAAARERSELLAPAVLAAGLAIGAKTTVAPMLLAVAVFVVPWRRLPSPRLLAGAGVVSGVLGGLWYVRNLVEHGSPLWPFVDAPWGDESPLVFVRAGESFLGTLDATLSDGRAEFYWRAVGLAPLLFAGAVAAAATVRTRRTVTAAAVACGGAFIWVNAPFTGRGPDPVIDYAVSTLRYLVPALAAAALALCLAWVDAGRRTRRVLELGTGAVALVALLLTLDAGFPAVPSWRTLALGAALGLALVAAPGLAGRRAAALAGAVITTVAVATTGGFGERHADNPDLNSAAVVRWLTTQPGFDTDHDPVHGAFQTLGVLAGDRLQHDLLLIDPDEDCATVLGYEGWIVLNDFQPSPYIPAFKPLECLTGVAPVYDDGLYRVYDRRQTAIRSSASSSPSATTEKSSSSIAAAAGSGSRRARLSRPS